MSPITIFLKNCFLCTNNELASAIQVSDRRFLNLAALTHDLVSATQIFLDTSLLIFELDKTGIVLYNYTTQIDSKQEIILTPFNYYQRVSKIVLCFVRATSLTADRYARVLLIANINH